MGEEERKEAPAENECVPHDHSLNEFLSDVSLAARELTSNIRSSVNKVLEQSVRIVNPSGNGPLLDMYETEESVIIETAPLEMPIPIPSISPCWETNSESASARETREPSTTAPSCCAKSTMANTCAAWKSRARIVIEEARARLRQGKLFITLPKPRGSEPKRIRIIAED